MNDIPMEGKFCGPCPCLNWGIRGFHSLERTCGIYDKHPSLTDEDRNSTYLRLPQCLKDRPRIVKEGE